MKLYKKKYYKDKYGFGIKTIFEEISKERKKYHTLIPGPSFTIPDANLEEFYEKYHHSIFNKHSKFMMVERLQDICSFVIDLDIKYKEDLSERQYTDETIDKLCKFFAFKSQKNFLN